MALYIASDTELPLIAWRQDVPAFHVRELADGQRGVCAQFTLAYVYYAGSHEGCGCPFNYGREYPEQEDDPIELAAARDCVSRLSEYVKAHRVRQIFSCYFDDEQKPRTYHRRVTPARLVAGDFVFREGELLEIEDGS